MTKMISMRRTILFPFAFALLSGCVIIGSPVGYFKPYCYTGESKGIDALLRTEGYYLMIDSFDTDGTIIPKEERTQYYIIFYDNGFFAHSVFGEKPSFNEKHIDWGLYQILNDTLKVRFVPSGIYRWRPSGEAWYVAESKDTIKALIYRYHSEGLSHSFVESFVNDEEYRITKATFVHSDTLPNPDKAYIKRSRSFWCNKDQYKAWKKAQREKRRKNNKCR